MNQCEDPTTPTTTVTTTVTSVAIDAALACHVHTVPGADKNSTVNVFDVAKKDGACREHAKVLNQMVSLCHPQGTAVAPFTCAPSGEPRLHLARCGVDALRLNTILRDVEPRVRQNYTPLLCTQLGNVSALAFAEDKSELKCGTVAANLNKAIDLFSSGNYQHCGTGFTTATTTASTSPTRTLSATPTSTNSATASSTPTSTVTTRVKCNGQVDHTDCDSFPVSNCNFLGNPVNVAGVNVRQFCPVLCDSCIQVIPTCNGVVDPAECNGVFVGKCDSFFAAVDVNERCPAMCGTCSSIPLSTTSQANTAELPDEHMLEYTFMMPELPPTMTSDTTPTTRTFSDMTYFVDFPMEMDYTDESVAAAESMMRFELMEFDFIEDPPTIPMEFYPGSIIVRVFVDSQATSDLLKAQKSALMAKLLKSLSTTAASTKQLEEAVQGKIEAKLAAAPYNLAPGSGKYEIKSVKVSGTQRKSYTVTLHLDSAKTADSIDRAMRTNGLAVQVGNVQFTAQPTTRWQCTPAAGMTVPTLPASDCTANAAALNKIVGLCQTNLPPIVCSPLTSFGTSALKVKAADSCTQVAASLSAGLAGMEKKLVLECTSDSRLGFLGQRCDAVAGLLDTAVGRINAGGSYQCDASVFGKSETAVFFFAPDDAFRTMVEAATFNEVSFRKKVEAQLAASMGVATSQVKVQTFNQATGAVLVKLMDRDAAALANNFNKMVEVGIDFAYEGQPLVAGSSAATTTAAASVVAEESSGSPIVMGLIAVVVVLFLLLALFAWRRTQSTKSSDTANSTAFEKSNPTPMVMFSKPAGEQYDSQLDQSLLDRTQTVLRKNEMVNNLRALSVRRDKEHGDANEGLYSDDDDDDNGYLDVHNFEETAQVFAANDEDADAEFQEAAHMITSVVPTQSSDDEQFEGFGASVHETSFGGSHGDGGSGYVDIAPEPAGKDSSQQWQSTFADRAKMFK